MQIVDYLKKIVEPINTRFFPYVIGSASVRLALLLLTYSVVAPQSRFLVGTWGSIAGSLSELYLRVA